eukprot:1145511-Pelagomonas_calceolata.AAC.3
MDRVVDAAWRKAYLGHQHPALHVNHPGNGHPAIDRCAHYHCPLCAARQAAQIVRCVCVCSEAPKYENSQFQCTCLTSQA